MDAVFDDFERTDPRPCAHAEGDFAFLNRVRSAYFARVRDLVDDWFDRYCAGEKADLRARLRSKDNRQFRAAFWELYLHEAFVRLGFDVACHPEIADTARQPDFRVERSDGAFYVEATLAADSDDETASERRRRAVYDSFARVKSPNFWLWIEIERTADTDPSVARARPALERWLAGIEPDAVAKDLAAGVPLHDQTSFVFDDAGWQIRVFPFPKTVDARNVAGSPLGAFGQSDPVALDDRGKIFRALRDKASAYGQLDLPYLIAVRTSSFSADEYDVNTALFGSEAVVFPLEGDTPARLDSQFKRPLVGSCWTSEHAGLRRPYWSRDCAMDRRSARTDTVAMSVRPANSE